MKKKDRAVKASSLKAAAIKHNIPNMKKKDRAVKASSPKAAAIKHNIPNMKKKDREVKASSLKAAAIKPRGSTTTNNKKLKKGKKPKVEVRAGSVG